MNNGIAAARGQAPALAAVVRMLAWQSLRRGWANVGRAILILCGVPTFLYVMIRLLDAVTAANLIEGIGTLKFLYFLAVVGTLPTLVLFEIARIRPLYTLPLTTRQIVHVQLGLGLIGVVGLYLLTIAYYGTVFSAPIPVLGPLLFLIPGLVIAAGLASLLVDACWWKPLLFLAVVWLGVYWITQRFDEEVLEAAGRDWFSPTPLELLSLVALSAVGYGVALHTARLDRRGDTRSWDVLEEYLYRFLGWVTQHLPSRVPAIRVSYPSTPTGAQFSFDWLTKGLVLPIFVAFFGSVSLIGAYYKPLEWFRNYTISIPVMLMIGMGINGYFVGLMDGPEQKGRMDRFKATRPLSDWQLATSALKTGLASTLLALLISIALAGAVYLYAYGLGCSPRDLLYYLFRQPAPPFRQGVEYYAGEFCAAAMIGWAVMGFNLSCVSTGRHLVVAAVWMGGVGVLMLNIFVEKHLSPEQFQQVGRIFVTGLALSAVGATVFCYQQAISRRLIPGWALPAGVALGLLAVGLAFAVPPYQGISARPEWPVALVGFGAFVALPFASAPLAVAWNRHR